MTKATFFNSPFIVFGIPFLFIACCIFLVQTPVFAANQSTLSLAITIDLLLSIPAIYYFLIRKKKIPKTTVVPVFILGLVVASFIIPKENQYLLQLAKTWLLPLVELGILSYVAFKVYKTVRLFKREKKNSIDFFTTAKKVSNEIAPGRIASLLATEIAVIYYSFFDWKKQKLKENEFSYHKNTGSSTLLIGIILIIVIETVVIHMLLAKWNITIAWVLTGLSIYTIFQIIALIKSIPKRPIQIDGDKLYLKYGILNETDITIEDIESIIFTTKEIESDKEIKKLSPIAHIEGHNILIKLNKENILNGFYGFNKKYKTIAFFVDDKEAFKNKIDSLLT